MSPPERPPAEEECDKKVHALLSKGGDGEDVLKRYLEASKTVNDEYMHWEEMKVDSRLRPYDAKALWAVAKMGRKLNIREVRIGTIRLNYVQTLAIDKTIHDLDFRILGEASADSRMPSSALQKKYLVNSLMEEAIASSQLEGAVTTRVVAKQMLMENRKPRGISEQMIMNNYLTMMHIRDHVNEEKLTVEMIKEIHGKITAGTLEKGEYEGRFRGDNDVKVLDAGTGMVLHTPPDFKKVDGLVGELCEFINRDSNEGYYLHPLVKATILHYMVGYIHPFYNGNGRTARALIYWYLMSKKYGYFEYMALSTAIKNAPAKYSRAYLYSESDNNDVTYFVKFNLHAFEAAVDSFERYVRKTRQDNDKILETVKNDPKLNFRQADMLIDMSRNIRPITIVEMQKRYKTTYQTARTDLLGLEKCGYLKLLRRGKTFVFLLDKGKYETTHCK